MNPWFTWSDSRLPCLFSARQAAENADLLCSLLGRQWLERAMVLQKGAGLHPLQHHWANATAPSFLYLNALAEDMKQLSSVEGFASVVADLKDRALFEPTIHMLRGGAFLTRSGPATMVRFHSGASTPTPDFDISLAGQTVPVEAKLLSSSDIQTAFGKWARKLAKSVRTHQALTSTPPTWLRIIVPDALALPDYESLRPILDETARLDPAFPSLVRSRVAVAVRMLVPPRPGPPTALTTLPTISVQAPRSPQEALRVQDRAKKASRQLRAATAGLRKGLLVLGGVRPGHVAYTARLLSQRLKAGNYSGIGAIVMTDWSILLETERTVLERLLTISPAGPHVALFEQVRFRPHGMIGSLMSLDPVPDEIAAYTFHSAAGVMATGLRAFIPATHTIPADTFPGAA